MSAWARRLAARALACGPLLAASLAGVRPTAYASTGAHAESYAVVVPPSSAVTDVSLAELRLIFRGERQRWRDGTPVVLFLQTPGGPGAAARSVVLRVLYQMDEQQYTRFWIARTFHDSATEGGPKLVSSDALARHFAATVPGGVAVIPAAEVDATVRALRVDGRLPGDDGYPLAAGGGGG